MNKKLLTIIYILILFISTSETTIAINNNQLLSKIETEFYGFDYKKDSDKNRVSRLEKSVYGKESTGDINKRIKKLSGDISADVIGLEIPPVKDTFLAEENAAEDSSVSYPIVDEIEQKLFNTTYKNRDFHTRIVTIEKKLFGKIYDVDDYSTRMDRIKSKMMPETIVDKSDNFDEIYLGNDAINKTKMDNLNPKKWLNLPFGQKNYTRQYANYGDYDYSSRYSENIPDNTQLDEELAQMEYDTFGTEFSNDTTQNRIKRLNSVNKAKKSSKKYDSQKFSQHMSTAMEIGAMILMVLAMIL